jgi:hypothetical protein
VAGGTRAALAIAFCIALLGSGCGSSTETTPEAADSPAGAEILADSGEERKIALDVRRYFVRNCPLPGSLREVRGETRGSRLLPSYVRYLKGAGAMCGNMATIEVDDTRVTIRSDIGGRATRNAAGDAFCNLMQGSDVADFTPGHELQDIEGDPIEVCPARTD